MRWRSLCTAVRRYRRPCKILVKNERNTGWKQSERVLLSELKEVQRNISERLLFGQAVRIRWGRSSSHFIEFSTLSAERKLFCNYALCLLLVLLFFRYLFSCVENSPFG